MNRIHVLALTAVLGSALAVACQAGTTPAAPTAAAKAATAPASPTSAAAAAGTAVGTAPSAGSPTAAAATRAAGSLRAGLVTVPGTADPNAILNGGGPGSETAYAIADPLLAPTLEGTLRPMLAESWAVSNGVNWTFKLRPNVRFSNGAPLTAQDVKFTFDLTADPANRYTAGTRWGNFTESVRVIDPQTIEFTSKGPDAIYPKRLTTMLIVPQAAFTAAGSAGFAQNPIGTGPYTLQSFTPNASANLAANPTTWRTPGVERLEYRGVTDPSTRNAALQTGEVGLIAGLTPENADAIKKAGKEVVTFPTGATVNIYLDSVGDDTGPFSNINARRAVSLALDRQGIITSLTSGFGAVASQVVSQGVFGFDPALPAFQYNAAEARRLITEAGAANTALQMQGAFAVGTGLTSSTAAQAVAASISQSGLRIELQTVEAAIFTQRFTGGGLGPISMASLPSGIDADNALQWFRGTGLPPAAVRFSNAEYDRLYTESKVEFDTAKRERTLQSMNKILNDQSGVVPFGRVPYILAHDGKVRDLIVVEAYRWDFALLKVN